MFINKRFFGKLRMVKGLKQILDSNKTKKSYKIANNAMIIGGIIGVTSLFYFNPFSGINKIIGDQLTNNERIHQRQLSKYALTQNLLGAGAVIGGFYYGLKKI